jgi:hypothetical protein
VTALVGIAWALFWDRSDPQVLKVKQLQSELFSGNSHSLSPQDLDRLRERLREESEKLEPEQREELWRAARDGFRARMHERIQKFLAAPENERIALLDEDIDRMEQQRGQWAQRRQQNSNRSAASGQGSRGPGNWSPGRRDARRRRFLDNTTPRERAELAAYFDALRKRRQQRGLPDWPGRGPWGRM